MLPALVLNHIIVHEFLVIVGASTVQLVVCAVQLYVAGNVHVLLLVLLNVAQFAFHFAVNVTAAFVVIAYHVLLLLLLVNVNFFVLVL